MDKRKRTDNTMDKRKRTKDKYEHRLHAKSERTSQLGIQNVLGQHYRWATRTPLLRYCSPQNDHQFMLVRFSVFIIYVIQISSITLVNLMYRILKFWYKQFRYFTLLSYICTKNHTFTVTLIFCQNNIVLISALTRFIILLFTLPILHVSQDSIFLLPLLYSRLLME